MLLKIHPENPETRKVKQVVECLQDGGLIIYPTDTVYGLGCDLFSKSAMERLYRYKGVKPNKANFSFICENLSNLSEYAAQLDTPTYKLMNRCLPGPYTFILKASGKLPAFFKNKKKTVGIRVPEHIITNTIVHALGRPLVSTSVHHSDSFIDYFTDPELIHEEMGHLVDMVIDGGIGGLEPSTVIDCTGREAVLVREGKGEVEIY